MKQFLSVCILISVISSSCGQKVTSKFAITGDINKDLNISLPNKEVFEEVMDRIRIDPGQTQILIKLQNGIKENYEWLLEETKKGKTGEIIPFDKRMGVTETDQRHQILNFQLNSK